MKQDLTARIQSKYDITRKIKTKDSKGVFKGGGFRGFKPPPKRTDFYLKIEGKVVEKKRKKRDGGGGVTCSHIFWVEIFSRVVEIFSGGWVEKFSGGGVLRIFFGGLTYFREGELKNFQGGGGVEIFPKGARFFREGFDFFRRSEIFFGRG